MSNIPKIDLDVERKAFERWVVEWILGAEEFIERRPDGLYTNTHCDFAWDAWRAAKAHAAGAQVENVMRIFAPLNE